MDAKTAREATDAIVKDIPMWIRNEISNAILDGHYHVSIHNTEKITDEIREGLKGNGYTFKEEYREVYAGKTLTSFIIQW